MTFQELPYIEESQIDYKEALEINKPKSWLKSVSAFANTKGGCLVFGVKNSPRVTVGLTDAQAVVTKITELIKTRISPAPRYQLSAIVLDEKNCILLDVQSGPSYPYYYNSDGIRMAYVRHGDQSEESSITELNNLILRGMNKTFDALPSSYRIGDVSFTLLSATFKNLVKEEFDLSKDLPSIGLVNEDGQVTNGGLLLCDQGILPQSRIFCTRWKGRCKGAVDNDALDDKEFRDTSLITLLQNAEDFIRNNSKSPWSIRGMTREERSDYPYKAIREVLVNAIIHRDYQAIGSEIHIDMFDDRVEIFSPGGMVNGRRVQDMDLRHIPSMRRNEIISDMFSRLHFMDRRGSGIDRIMTSYAEVVEKPEFYSDSDFFLVTLPNRSAAAPAQTSFIDIAIPEQHSEHSPLNLGSSPSNLGSSPSNLGSSPSNLGSSPSNLGSSDDTELAAFEKKLLDDASIRWYSATKEHTIELFRRYRYQYTFNYKNVADIYGVKDKAASAIIVKLAKAGLIYRSKFGTYQFKK